jgi:hypothetical protein
MHCVNFTASELPESADDPAADELDDAFEGSLPHAATPIPSATSTATSAAHRQRPPGGVRRIA